MTKNSIHPIVFSLGISSFGLFACTPDSTAVDDEVGTGDSGTDSTSAADEVGTSTTDTTTDTTDTSTTTTDTTTDTTTTTDTATDTTTDTTDTGPLGDAMLRVLHLGVDAPNVDVYLDGGLAVGDLPFQSGTDYLPVPAGPHAYAVTAAGAPIDTAVLMGDLDLAGDTKYSAVAFNYLAEITALVLVDDDSGIAPGEIRYQVSHTAPDVGQVDIWLLTDPPTPLFVDLDFGTTQSLDAPAGAIPIGIDVDNDMIPDLTFSVPDLGADILVDVFAVNEAGGAPVFLLAHLPDGTTARIDADVCGDGVISGLEVCDGDDLAGSSCVDQGFMDGTLACAADCSAYDTSLCSNATCGNDVIEDAEQCDGSDLGGQVCSDIDPDLYSAGTLACDNMCSFDDSACNSGTCCMAGGAGSCDVDAIRACTCAIDSFCCNNSWDNLCVGEAVDCGAVCP